MMEPSDNRGWKKCQKNKIFYLKNDMFREDIKRGKENEKGGYLLPIILLGAKWKKYIIISLYGRNQRKGLGKNEPNISLSQI